MGKRKPFGRKGNKGNKGGAWKKPRTEHQATDKEAGFGEWVYENASFEKYYKAQNIVLEEEWEAFVKHLAMPLPTTFRINNSCAYAEKIQERIASDFKFEDLVIDGEKVDPISQMQWYPDGKGFQWSVERRKIKKLEILSEFQKWLVNLSDAGDITRQEAVSMIPPLVLGVESHHKVLDMCAAPGSKTSQLLESLHADESKTGKLPTGLVVANDIDIKRAYMLVHQTKRVGSPALVITCHEAQKFPLLSSTDNKQGFFDRILCDAPCSGDGTMRKNPLIWQKWHVKNGLSLHPLQLSIAKHGTSLLKIGGRMCYSTCTFNPIENEAVVAELLRWSNGALKLVDVSEVLPRLKRRAGISTWTVMDHDLNEVAGFDADAEEKRGQYKKLLPTMFPPTKEEAESFYLERCMRCLPHDENTGGFFICLLEKVAPTPDDAVAETDSKSSNKKSKSTGEEYLDFKDYDDIKTSYKMKDEFEASQLFTRSDTGKSVTFVTSSVSKELLPAMKALNMKVVYAGIKMFERHDLGVGASGMYRLTQTGSHIAKPFMQTRKLEVCNRDFQYMLERRGDLLQFDVFTDKLKDIFISSPLGSYVCTLARDDGVPLTTPEQMLLNLVVWRGRNTVNVMTSKPDGLALAATLKALNLYDEALGAEIAALKQSKKDKAQTEEKKSNDKPDSNEE
ncbi:tRNA (cytosine-5-)-methyltransferase NSUN2 [Thraustotheca clavata]|uniref:tRNA (Cytosine-5-)-methyltransferase NSUN2 n=1 Tax=Thraustotheca clavata TaxID=74557 RepID=A0A1V9ZC50_9STRA|nr:tRNA (cytosine-5-)-methyltransferase NSUN2 [Thraustotheca clavata]